MTAQALLLDRRRLLLAALALPGVAAAAPEPRSLRFAVFRNGAHVGEHRMSFTVAGDAVTAISEAAMVIRLGPVPIYRYLHHAEERWAGGRFQTLSTATNSNGKRERVAAAREASAVAIEHGDGRINAPADAAPLTHWNTAAFQGPLFNPQTGKLLKVSVKAVTPRHWAVRGEAEIDDVYDAGGVWAGLKGKLPDGSMVEYRPI